MLVHIGDNSPFVRRSLLKVYLKESTQAAQACVIWMHGLGADAHDMMGLADQLVLAVPVRHVFIDAPVRPVTLNNGMPMRAWYDILGTSLLDRQDLDGILQSEKIIKDVIADQLAAGFTSQQIFLAGFSQGGAMALFAGLRAAQPLGGIISLSAYLPLASECKSAHKIPIFLACGMYDTLVLPLWTKHCIEWLHAHDIRQIDTHEYPMEHAICMQEINDLAEWLNARVVALTQCLEKN